MIRRRRECERCNRRFTTYERVEEMMPSVVKKDGRRETYDRVKIVNGLKRACEKRPVSINTIEAIADRIDEIGSGAWNVIDYKTGRVPTPRELEGLFAPQLLLEAAMALRGGFDKVSGKPGEIVLSYWQANGLGAGGDIKDIKGSDELVPKMVALVEQMAERFANPDTPYKALPWPEFIPHFNDYAHLERVAEWSTAGGEE